MMAFSWSPCSRSVYMRSLLLQDNFYRTTHMHSADYAVARFLSVCLSIRPSVAHAGIESKRLYISSKFFSPSGSPTILVFPHQTEWQYSYGDYGIVTMEGEWETASKLSNGTSLNNLQWPFQGHDYSTSNDLKMVQHTAIGLLTIADQ